MTNLTNLNLGKDLAKLPIDERVHLMMQFRAADFVEKPTPISELEYNTLDTSIKTNEEIRAYNRANNACNNLFSQFDYIAKCVASVELQAHYFKLLWAVNRQTEFILDGLSYFLFSLSKSLKDNKAKKIDYDDLIFDCLKRAATPFTKLEQKTDKDGSKWIVNKLKNVEVYQQKADELNAAFAKLEAEIAKYHEIAQKENLHLKPFTDMIPKLLKEAKGHFEWLDWLEGEV